MGDLKLFRIENGTAVELQGTALALERPLQALIERNMEALFGVRFVASEQSTGKKHGGHIDSYLNLCVPKPRPRHATRRYSLMCVTNVERSCM
jgi:hypothetical protein